MNDCNVHLSDVSGAGVCYDSDADKGLREETVRKRKKARRAQWKKEIDEAQSLEDVVRIYEKYDLRDLEAFLTGMKKGSILEFVCGKIPNPNPNPLPKYKRHPHQRRMSNKTIEEASKALEAIGSKKYETFEALYDAVKKIGDQVSGFGPLATYDFSIRYGYGKGLHPEEEVYIHAGTLTGAKYVLGNERKIKVWDRIPVSEFPEVMRKINGLHLENLLCTYKKKMKEIIENK